MTPLAAIERVVRIYSGEVRCSRCDWVASMTGDTEADVTSFMRALWQDHVARLHRPERPS